MIYSLLLCSGVCVFLSANLLYSLFFFFSFFLLVMIFLCLTGLDFFGFILLNIYIGAISVMFLFIIMIINFRKPVFVDFIDGFFGFILILLFFLEIIYFFFFFF